jgi:hypothetical protein
LEKYADQSIDLSDLIEAEHIKTAKRLKESIEEYQEKIVGQIVARNPECKRAGTYERGLVTSLGEVLLKIAKQDRFRRWKKHDISHARSSLSIRRKKYSQELRMLYLQQTLRQGCHTASLELS